jgi:uncharacterized membrane protein YozB (DUF420 family)
VSGALVLALSAPLASLFLSAAHRFDQEGSISNPDWLIRPIVTLGLILLAYAAFRHLFERKAGEPLEQWLLARDRQLGSFPAVAFVTALGASALLFSLFAYAVSHPEFDQYYHREDSVFETGTAFALLLSGVALLVAAVRAVRVRLRLSRWLALLIAATGLASIFLGLEEISYGQRMFGWSTPEPVAAANLQRETNLHNLLTHRAQAAILWVIGLLLVLAAGASTVLRRWFSGPLVQFLPHQVFLPFAAGVWLLTSHAGFHEVLEQIVAVLALLYACQLALVAGRSHD